MEAGREFGASELERALCLRSSQVRTWEQNGGTEPERWLWQRIALASSDNVPMERGVSLAS
ncbi:hypothetical protein F3Y22_tig00010968pilonHSYRG00123 [Hibiscus syriacus]|uniref:Uncharacterized protein n=1 Tax=Hibiscus syriacus TaxID=106335 RepID=A0A6A3C985_HIBSY|nr:hypothetical protein F3Y22_tig00010968pilonHSYRG00123 [Hibiscus syriacus]